MNWKLIQQRRRERDEDTTSNPDLAAPGGFLGNQAGREVEEPEPGG